MGTAGWSFAFDELVGLLTAWAVAAARLFGVMAILPVFSRLGLAGLVRGGVALALALPLAPALLPAVEAARDALPPTTWLLLLAKEALIGVTLITIFFASGGMGMLVEAVYASHAVWPPLDPLPRFSAEAAWHLLTLLDRLMRVALILAAPLLVALVLAELALAFVGRFAPQLNVFDLSLTAKGLAYVVLLPLYAGFLILYLRDGLAPLLRVTDELRVLAP